MDWFKLIMFYKDNYTNEQIDQFVKMGKITQPQADKIKASKTV